MAIIVGSGYYLPMLTTYVLVIEKAGSSRVQIGKKRIVMENGIYLYVGSAKKGLAQRLARHARKEKKRFWHIDYVTSREDTSLRAIFLSPATECETLSTVGRLGTLFGSRLGSSDCRCPSHFVKLDAADLDVLRTQLARKGLIEFFSP